MQIVSLCIRDRQRSHLVNLNTSQMIDRTRATEQSVIPLFPNKLIIDHKKYMTAEQPLACFLMLVLQSHGAL